MRRSNHHHFDDAAPPSVVYIPPKVPRSSTIRHRSYSRMMPLKRRSFWVLFVCCILAIWTILATTSSSSIQEGIVFPNTEQTIPLNRKTILKRLVKDRFPKCQNHLHRQPSSEMRSPLVRNIWLDRLPTNYRPKKHVLSFSLVLCLKDQSLDWITEYIGSYAKSMTNVTILADPDVTDRDEVMNTLTSLWPSTTTTKNSTSISVVEWISVPNMSGCDYSYAYWVNRTLPSIRKDQIYVFLRNTVELHPIVLQATTPRPLSNLVALAQSDRRFACSHDWHPYHVTDVLTAVSPAEDNNPTTTYHGTIGRNTKSSSVANMSQWLEAVEIDLPHPITKVCYGGNFAVRGDCILNPQSSVGTKVYHSLLSALSQDPHGEKFAEQSWAGMWAPPLQDGIAIAIVKHATHLVCVGHAIRGALAYTSSETRTKSTMLASARSIFSFLGCVVLGIFLKRALAARQSLSS